MGHRSRRNYQFNKTQLKSKFPKIRVHGSKIRDQIRGELGALWVKLIPKDESHIPWIKSMEENLNFNGGILLFKLGEEVFNGRF